MRIKFFVEELSAEEALYNLVPKIIGPGHSIKIYSFQGKHDLLNNLSNRLKALKRGFASDDRIVILIDEDREDCKALKGKLETIANASGFNSKSAVLPGTMFHVLNRIAVEELEAWFFGDMNALLNAFPKLPASLREKASFRNPDGINGGTWEALERVLNKYGYYSGGIPKVELARAVSQHMNPQNNRSRSFQVFRDGLAEMVRTRHN